MTAVFTHPACARHDPGAHVENPGRLAAIERALATPEAAEALERREAEPATRRDLERVHAPAHVDAMARLGARDARVALDPDTTFAGRATWDAALAAAGAAMDAARAGLDGTPAFALTRPPGHHAGGIRAARAPGGSRLRGRAARAPGGSRLRGRAARAPGGSRLREAMGFCVFNNVAIAAEWALAEGGARRVAILDVDVHHGNGTQDAFYARGDVLYVSLHQSPLYPGTGQPEEHGEGPGRGLTLNVPLPAGTGDAEYARRMEERVLPALEGFAPDLLLVSAGYDAHENDPLGGLRLTTPFYGALTQRLLGLGIPIAAVLEGGYDPDALAASVVATVRALAGRPPDAPWEDVLTGGPGDVAPARRP